MKIKLSILLLFILRVSFGKSIDLTQSVEIGGINQFLSIQGNDINRPLLLYLHGGPGAAVSAHKNEVTKKLEDYFVVAHWDQRCAGKTMELNPLQPPPTLKLMEKDAEEVMAYLLKKFKREKLYILGNSWGTLLGFNLAQKYPEKIFAYIAVSPVVDNKKSQGKTLKIFKDFFKKEENAKALGQLSEVKIPYENVKQMLIQYRWETEFEGGKITDEEFKGLLSYFESWEKLWMPLYRELYSINIEAVVPELKCPVYFIVGENDYTCYFELTKKYFNQLKAPQKEIFWLENIGHNIPAYASNKMQNIIIENIL